MILHDITIQTISDISFGSRLKHSHGMKSHAAAIAFGNLPVLESDGSEDSRPASANPRLLSRKGPRPAWDSYAAFNAKLALTPS